MQTFVLLTAASVFFPIAAHLVASRRFNRFAENLKARLDPQGPGSAVPPTVSRDVPRIVQDFAGRAGATTDGTARLVRLRQAAELRMAPDKPWSKIDCDQTLAVQQPGFVWHARQPLGPLTMFSVIDAFVENRGLLEARLFGSIPVARFAGPEADRGELMRYLAEIAWVPDAILKNPALRWKKSGECSIEVCAESTSGLVSVNLIFDDDGDITEMHADNRPAVEKGETVLRSWRGYFSNYREMGGRRIPTRGEVGYVYESGYSAYWRGEVIAYQVE